MTRFHPAPLMDGEANQNIRKKKQKAYYSILSMVPNKN